MQKQVVRSLRMWGCAAMLGAAMATMVASAAHASGAGLTHGASMTALSASALVQPADTPEEFVRPKRALAKRLVAPTVIDLGQWSGEKSAGIQREGVTQVGTQRASAATASVGQTQSALKWTPSPRGGLVAALSFTSAQALGVRLGVRIDKLPGSALLRVYAQNAPGDVFEIAGQRVLQVLESNRLAGDTSDAARTWWTPGAHADELTLEIELPPGTPSSAVQVSVPSVVHFFEELSRPVAEAEEAADAEAAPHITKVGESSFCEQDATCFDEYDAQRNAVARMIYVETDGAYACTGTLVNDTAGSRTPYFVTANHCISTQTVASTLQTYWFYRSPTCNAGTLSAASRTLQNGATLLYGTASPDFSLLRLNDTPPAGAVFAGWSAGSVERSSALVGIHHPAADLLKLSMGAVDGAATCMPQGDGYVGCLSDSATSMNGTYYRVKWSKGTTEGGSSGSGMFSNGALTGVLSSGTSSCFSMQAYSFYARFDSVFPALKQWLAAEPEARVDTTDNGSPSGTRSAVYRFYNYKTGAHFYTISAPERDFVIEAFPDFQYENVAFYAYPNATAGKDAVYRFYNSQTGAHFYTISAPERDFVIEAFPAFKFESTAWYAQTGEGNGATPIYRFYNSQTGAHFYTASAPERDFVISDFPNFHYEGPVYYVWTAP